MNTFNCDLFDSDHIETHIDAAHVRVDMSEVQPTIEASVFLTPEDARALAANLIEIANIIDGTLVMPVAEAPVTPASYSNLSPLCQTIYQHMKRAGSISAREAMNDYGITSASLARRICDIRAEGFSISSDRRRHPISKQLYTRYMLAV